MKTVTVKKDALVEKIKANREEHRAVFLRAQEKYREKVIELLDQRLDEARRGAPISLHFGLPVPEDYTHEYDMALSQLEWEEAESVTLDQQSFRELVMNEWRWAQAFAGNTESYLVA